MPSADFFRSLGLFVAEDFLSADSCLALRSEMDASASKKATIYRGVQEGILDESSRRALAARVSEATWRLVGDQLRAIKPRFEEHFGVSLSPNFHGPVFLIYPPGGFYRPHRDASEESRNESSGRLVSVVIFLNAQTREPAAHTFGDGGLTFYGLMDGPAWSKCAFTVSPARGVLVAFRSDVLHEAQAVSFGKKYAVVSWFTRKEEPAQSQSIRSDDLKQLS